MTIPNVDTIRTKETARDLAIDWQSWQSEQALSWHELSQWQALFIVLGERFNLTEEFKENGIL